LPVRRAFVFSDGGLALLSEGGLMETFVEMEMDCCQLFSSLLPFRHLEPDQQASIAATYKLVNLPAGELLIEQGMPVSHVGIIRSGTAKVTVLDYNKDELLCGRLKTGDFLFDVAILTNNRAASSVTSLEPSSCFLQSRQDFFETIQIYPNLKDFFYRNTALGVWWGHELFCRGCEPGFHGEHDMDYRLPFIQKALDFIHRNYHKPITLEMVANETAMSKFHFSRMFKQHMGFSFKQYLNRKRIEAAKSLIMSNGYNITEASFAVGFNDASYFSRVFRELEGGPPKRLLACPE
jgi:AraC-like DNA-binding protein